MSTALLLIDLQNDYFPGRRDGAGGCRRWRSRRCAELSRRFARSGHCPLVHVRNESSRAGATRLRARHARRRNSSASAPRDGETVFTKHFPNAFRDTRLLDHALARDRARGHRRTMTRCAIDTSTRAASDLVPCVLAHDGSATRGLGVGGRTACMAAILQARSPRRCAAAPRSSHRVRDRRCATRSPALRRLAAATACRFRAKARSAKGRDDNRCASRRCKGSATISSWSTATRAAVRAVAPAQMRRLADRRFGVGCDQVLVVEPARVSADADFRYRIFNADGGEVEQCGNGARCFVALRARAAA